MIKVPWFPDLAKCRHCALKFGSWFPVRHWPLNLWLISQIIRYPTAKLLWLSEYIVRINWSLEIPMGFLFKSALWGCIGMVFNECVPKTLYVWVNILWTTGKYHQLWKNVPMSDSHKSMVVFYLSIWLIYMIYYIILYYIWLYLPLIFPFSVNVFFFLFLYFALPCSFPPCSLADYYTPMGVAINIKQVNSS